MASNEDISRRRLAAQRLSGARFERPEDVVRWLGAVQAQDYLGALWAVGVRMKHAHEPDIERAIAERRIVRMWPMRGTLHFVAPEDARWMTSLLAPKIVAGAESRLRGLKLDAKTFSRAGEALGRALEGGKRLTRPDTYATLERAKISTAGQRGIHILWKLAQDCLICFGPREGKQQTFVLLDDWLPKTKPKARDEALAELAVRYFKSHGPATVADFQWWSGLRAVQAREAVQLARSQLEEDDGLYFVDSATHAEHTFALPPFDEFLVGYTDRSAMLDPAHVKRVNGGGGLLNPVVVLDAQVVASWKRTLTKKQVRVRVSPFERIAKKQQHAVRQAFARYANFLRLDLDDDLQP